MAVDASEPYSDGWWLNRLAVALWNRRVGRYGPITWTSTMFNRMKARPPLDLLDAHFRGDAPLPVVAAGWADHFREIIRLGQLNVAELVVVAKANRMSLQDFRTAAADDQVGDQVAREIMRYNAMATLSRDVHEDMLCFGDGYAIVAPPKAGQKYGRVSAESPMQVITACDPATEETLAGLKMFRDEWDSTDFAYLYMPGRVEVFRNSGASVMTQAGYQATNGWEHDDQLSGSSFPGEVAVVRFRNRQGVGEFERHLGTLDRINDQVLNMLVIGKVQAFRQRALVNAPAEDDEGNDIDYSDSFVAAPGSLWQLPEGAEFWESNPTDLSPIRMAIKDDLEHIAAITSTPLNTITPDAAGGSAEGATLMREEHVYAVEDRRARAAQGWAKVMSLCFLGIHDTERADVTQIEPLWGPVERYTLIDRSTSAASLKGILPAEAIFTDILGYPPAEVPELQKMRAADTIFLSAVLPIPTFDQAAVAGDEAAGVSTSALPGAPAPGTPTAPVGQAIAPQVPVVRHLVPGPNPNDPRQR